MNEIPSFAGQAPIDLPSDSAGEPLAEAIDWLSSRGPVPRHPIGNGQSGSDLQRTRAVPDPMAAGLDDRGLQGHPAGGDPIRSGQTIYGLQGAPAASDPIGNGPAESDLPGECAVPDPLAAGQVVRDLRYDIAGGDPIGGGQVGYDLPRELASPDPDELVDLTPERLAGVDPERLAAIEEQCAAIRQCYLEVAFAMRQRVAVGNRLSAFIRTNRCGWSLELPETERAKVTRAAARMIKAARAGDGPAEVVLLVGLSDRASAPWAEHEEMRKAELAQLVADLPGIGFVRRTLGFGPVSFGKILGEAGALHRYRRPSKLWRRLCLGLVQGERQRKYADAELALAHGYSPRRRSISWQAFEPVLRAQLRGNKQTGETVAIGHYGALYLDAKAMYLARDGWTKMHAHRAGWRYAEKRLLRDLWRAWRDDLLAVGR